MGFFDDLFKSDELRQRWQKEAEEKVYPYFKSGGSAYESYRKCLRDLVYKKAFSEVITMGYYEAVTKVMGYYMEDHEPVLRQLMVDYTHAAAQRILPPPGANQPIPMSVDFVRCGSKGTAVRNPTLALLKPSGEIRFQCIGHKHRSWWAWTSLYDDGTRMNPGLALESMAPIHEWEVVIEG
jgi:hypothetical protein